MNTVPDKKAAKGPSRDLDKKSGGLSEAEIKAAANRIAAERVRKIELAARQDAKGMEAAKGVIEQLQKDIDEKGKQIDKDIDKQQESIDDFGSWLKERKLASEHPLTYKPPEERERLRQERKKNGGTTMERMWKEVKSWFSPKKKKHTSNKAE